MHDNCGHQCFKYSYNIAKERYYWPNMYNEIHAYILKCGPCQRNQPSLKSPIVPLQPLPVITKVWYRVGMDYTGPLFELEGYKYILTFIDHFTKWIETRPLKTKESKEVAKGIFYSRKLFKKPTTANIFSLHHTILKQMALLSQHIRR